VNSITAQFVDQGDYLLVNCKSNASIADKSRTLDSVAEFIKGSSCHKVLFDIRQSLPAMSEDDHFACGELLNQRQKQFSGCKLAFLTERNAPVLFLSLAYSKGFNGFIELDSKSDASLWLNGQLR
jgi:hypothetical protein